MIFGKWFLSWRLSKKDNSFFDTYKRVLGTVRLHACDHEVLAILDRELSYIRIGSATYATEYANKHAYFFDLAFVCELVMGKNHVCFGHPLDGNSSFRAWKLIAKLVVRCRGQGFNTQNLVLYRNTLCHIFDICNDMDYDSDHPIRDNRRWKLIAMVLLSEAILRENSQLKIPGRFAPVLNTRLVPRLKCAFPLPKNAFTIAYKYFHLLSSRTG